MNTLEGKTILIGKEPGQGRLLIAVGAGPQALTAVLGQPGCVPLSVSRCRPAEGMAHCKIEVSPSGVMTVHNLKAQNTTTVDGLQIEQKRVRETSRLGLGPDGYEVSVSAVLAAAAKLVQTRTAGGCTASGGGRKPVPEYSLRPLERVWDKYHTSLLDISRRQRKVNLLRSAAPLFTLGAGALAMVSRTVEGLESIAGLTAVLFVAGLAIMVYGFYLSSRDKSIEEREELTEYLQSHYTCPNPDCRHFVGATPYKVLRQNKKCPYCGCTLTDK